MKTLITIFLIILALILGSITPAFSQNPELYFQKGLVKEEGEGSLLEAIELYNKIVENKDAERVLQAKALLHIGMCYEKLGRNEATKAYQNLVANFPGQKNEVAIARERLGKLIILGKADIDNRSITLQKVWTGPASISMGAPSPDGRFLTYMDEETGDLAIRELSTGKTHLLTKEGTWEDPMQFTIGSTISPNNKQVAYSWYNINNNYEIRLLDIDNPQPNVLYGNKNEDIYPCQWSKDGKILYARSYQNKTRHCRIIAITVSDGDIKVLKTFNFFYWMQLSVSSGDHFIAFDVPNDKDDGNFDIHLVSSDGKHESALVEHPANDRILGWFPNKNQILFKSDRSGTWDAWTVSVLNGKVSGEPKRVLAGIGQVEPKGFTDNGNYYFSNFLRKFNTFTIPFDPIKGRLKIESRKPLLGSIRYAEWSPDSKSLAYIKEIAKESGPGKYHRPLFILDIKTGKERKLVDWRLMLPRWSPDGKVLLASGYDKGGRGLKKDYEGGIYTIDAASGKVTELLPFSKSQESDTGISLWVRSAVEWSHDQKSIYYTTNDQLIRRNLATGREKTLLNNKKFSRTLDLSTDGKYLLFYTENKVNIIPASGGKVITVANHKSEFLGANAGGNNAVWSPDDKYILFTENTGDGSVLWRISAEGKNQKELWRSKDPIASFNIHPDGQKTVISIFDQKTEIWRLENLLSNDEKVNK